MILLDTNVISELMRRNPAAHVYTWLSRQSPPDIFISATTEAELRYGIAVLPAGRRRDLITAALDAILAIDFAGRILPFDSPAAMAFAQISAERRRIGLPISQFDAQIASIAKSRSASLATRNVADFDRCGIPLIDPWTAPA